MLAAADLGYAGLPFNWVTMPDQFTLAAFERAELDAAPTAPPVFAEIALISSHAPWTPIPDLLPWDALGDGRGLRRHGRARRPDPGGGLERPRPRPRPVRPVDRLQPAHGRAPSPSAAPAASAPLMVVLGDHQPAAFVSRDAGGRDVPVHVIGPPDAIARLDGWGWTPGLIPGPDAPVWGMETFRDRFLAAFGTADRRLRCLAPGPLPNADRVLISSEMTQTPALDEAPTFQRAEMTGAGLGGPAGRARDRRPAAPPTRTGRAAERAAWALYAPLLGIGARAPYLFAQVGQSLDGRVATVSGDARDVSGPARASRTSTAAARSPTPSSSASAPR